jgi:hypothetical protein
MKSFEKLFLARVLFGEFFFEMSHCPTRIALGALYKEERSTPHNTKQESKGIHSKA